MNLRKYMLSALRREQDELREQLRYQTKAIRQLERANLQACLFEVRIFGGFGCDHKVEHHQKGGSLRRAIATAERKFRCLAPHSESDPSYFVNLIIPGFRRLSIPEELWKQYTRPSRQARKKK